MSSMSTPEKVDKYSIHPSQVFSLPVREQYVHKLRFVAVSKQDQTSGASVVSERLAALEEGAYWHADCTVTGVS